MTMKGPELNFKGSGDTVLRVRYVWIAFKNGSIPTNKAARDTWNTQRSGPPKGHVIRTEMSRHVLPLSAGKGRMSTKTNREQTSNQSSSSAVQAGFFLVNSESGSQLALLKKLSNILMET